MSTNNPGNTLPAHSDDESEVRAPRIGTVVWGLIVVILAALIVVSALGWVVLDETYVVIGLMMGAGIALVLGGLLSARKNPRQAAGKK